NHNHASVLLRQRGVQQRPEPLPFRVAGLWEQARAISDEQLLWHRLHRQFGHAVSATKEHLGSLLHLPAVMFDKVDREKRSLTFARTRFHTTEAMDLFRVSDCDKS